MKEISAGAIIFSKDKKRKYLLLYYPGNHWDFPKGNIEKREEEKETVIREVKEETGIKALNFIEGFKEKVSYSYKRKKKVIHKEVIFYLAETEQKEIKLSHEHKDFDWLEYDKAMERLTFKNAKDILKKAEDYLTLIS